MSEGFDRSTWQARIAAWWRETASDLAGTMARLGVRTSYGLLVASAWLPLLTEHAREPAAAVAALVAVVSGVGNNLLSNVLQGAYDRATAAQQAEQEVIDEPGVRPEYQRMLSELDVVGAAQQALGEQWAAFEARLRQELGELGGRLEVTTEGGALVFGGVHTAGGEFVGRDKIIKGGEGGTVVGGNVYDSTFVTMKLVAPAAERIVRHWRRPRGTADLRPATQEYLNYVLDRHQYLNLKGMGVADRVALRLPLLDLYVPLKARLQLPEAETWKRELQLAGRRMDAEAQQALAGRLGEPQPVLDMLKQHDGLIVLGDPGAGKTTFLKFLALKLALGKGGELGLGERLPILVPLSAYATALAEADVRLDDFVVGYFHDVGVDLPIDEMLAVALQQGTALVLLDGLDEVKETRQRDLVVERVVHFYAFHRGAGNKFVLSSRIVGYREVRPIAEGLAECTLVDFEDEEIEAFVAKWTAALEKQALGDTAVAVGDAERERKGLLDAIRGNPGVRRLAANPLLLTILALMKRQGVVLPERRVELYDHYVRTLLSSWNRARGLGRPPTRDLDVVQTVRILAPLALWMHEVNPGLGLVKREELRRRLTAVYEERGEPNPEAAAQQFLSDVRDHAGLLLERGPGEYGFIHLTFEEYLAAVAVALQGPTEITPIVEQLSRHVGDAAWREVARLAVCYLGIIQQREEAAGAVVEQLIDQAPGGPGEAVVLAGEAVLDACPAGVPARSRARTVAALVPAMQGGDAAPQLRRRAGLLLGQLGWLPDDLDAFVEVTPGPFLYGDKREKREITDRYWMAKYPVTNAQYARFIGDGGYERQEWWSDEGWAWRMGTYDSKVKGDWLKRWLAQRPAEQRNQPYWWDDAEWNNRIFPVVGVSWFEAQAYARWLDSQVEALVIDGRPAQRKPEGYSVRLPTEEEWERAARGQHGREYPWGNEFEPASANTARSKGEEQERIGTTAVCTYPQGASPSGVWDMSGNVWEWTASRWSKRGPDYVLRGGSWMYTSLLARCASRYRYLPSYWGSSLGFRVVVSLAGSDS